MSFTMLNKIIIATWCAQLNIISLLATFPMVDLAKHYPDLQRTSSVNYSTKCCESDGNQPQHLQSNDMKIYNPEKAFDFILNETYRLVKNEAKDLISEPRTFGKIKKLQMSLLPVMFKLGAMSTIIMVILFLTLKGVAIGLLLLAINIGFVIAKVIAAKKEHNHHQEWQPPIWNSPPIFAPSPPVAPVAPVQKEVHIHLHNNGEKHESKYSDQPYGSFVVPSNIDNDYKQGYQQSYPLYNSYGMPVSYGTAKKFYGGPEISGSGSGTGSSGIGTDSIWPTGTSQYNRKQD